MQIYQGKSVFSGIAIGKIRVYKKNAVSYTHLTLPTT